MAEESKKKTPSQTAMEQAESHKPTLDQAKSMLRGWLSERNITYTKVTARTVGFADLARDSAIFVKVWGWKVEQGRLHWAAMRQFGRDNHFIVETDLDM